MSILIFDEQIRAQIASAIERARDQAVPWDSIKQSVVDDRAMPTAELKLADRKPGIDYVARSQFLQLASYRVAISFEHQPAGLIKHLSVSVGRPGKLPHPVAVAEICKAYGFSSFPPQRDGRVWMEEFEPGHQAINVVEIEPEP